MLPVSTVVEGAFPAAFYDVRSQQQTEEGRGKAPVQTVSTRTFHPFPPEKQSDRKHEIPLFLLFHSTACLNILVYITFQRRAAPKRYFFLSDVREAAIVSGLSTCVGGCWNAAGASDVSVRGDADRLVTVSTFVL